MDVQPLKCPTCGRLFAANHDAEFECCGETIFISVPRERRRANQPNALNRDGIKRQSAWQSEVRKHCNIRCEHWGVRNGSSGCLLSPTKPCDIRYYNAKGKACFQDPPKFPSKWSGKVGFLVSCYTEFGGTEFWHRALAPRLDSVGGMVVASGGLHCGHEYLPGGAPIGIGRDAAIQLASDVEVLIVWGVGRELGEVIKAVPRDKRPKVIAVNHSDGSSWYFREVMEQMEPWTDKFVHVCPTGKQVIPEDRWKDAYFIANGIDETRIHSTVTRQAMRSKYGVAPGQFAIVTISRVSPEKRIELVVETAKLLPDYYQFIVIGPCYESKYGDRIRELSANVSNFRIYDPVDNPGDVLNGADLFLLTSEYEGFALAMGEAIMLGVPVVSTQVGILEDLGFLARTVAPETATAQCFADHIVADLSDEKRRTDRAREAQSTIRGKYSADQFAKQWQSLIDATIEG